MLAGHTYLVYKTHVPIKGFYLPATTMWAVPMYIVHAGKPAGKWYQKGVEIFAEY